MAENSKTPSLVDEVTRSGLDPDVVATAFRVRRHVHRYLNETEGGIIPVVAIEFVPDLRVCVGDRVYWAMEENDLSELTAEFVLKAYESDLADRLAAFHTQTLAVLEGYD